MIKPLSCVLAASLCLAASTRAQVVIVSEQSGAGSLVAAEPGRLTIRDHKGDSREYLIQDPEAGFVDLAGARLDAPAEVTVTGFLPIQSLKAGDRVRCRALLSRRGAAGDGVSEFTLLPADAELAFAFDALPSSLNEKALAELIGEVVRLSRGRLTLRVGDNEQLLRDRITLSVPDAARLAVESSDLSLASAGDSVEEFHAQQLSTGDWLLRGLRVRLAEDAKRAKPESTAEDEKYGRLSDEPRTPRDERSRNFVLHTDVSERSAAILLDKLEGMVALVSQYYGRTSPSPIECYVVRDMSQWASHPLEEIGVAKISRGEGVTVSFSLGQQHKSTVYACAEHSVVQHEAVHAFCHQAFGSTGPTWYAEGMAELGNYWKRGEQAVAVNEHVIRYLKTTEQKPLSEVVNAGQITGDSWQAYAWRWALCHLLANNPNYSGRFKELGIGMMLGQEVSFASAYGSVAQQISFEYDQFCKHVDNGYRADLCAWDWDARFRTASGRGIVKCKIEAGRGWQPSGVRLERGKRYELAARGEWKTTKDAPPVSANGSAAGPGRLIGVVMADFLLTEPFELSERAEFIAPADGDLYLRCQDDWTQLADNDGDLEVFVRRAQGEAESQ